MQNNKFTEIPMRTWNWLGVNEVSTEIKSEIENIKIEAGQTQKVSQINLSNDEQAKKLHIKVEANAHLELTIVDLSEADSLSEIVVDLDGDDEHYEGTGTTYNNLSYEFEQISQKIDNILREKGLKA